MPKSIFIRIESGKKLEKREREREREREITQSYLGSLGDPVIFFSKTSKVKKMAELVSI